MRAFIFTLAALGLSLAPAISADLPLNPIVTQKTIGTTICLPGWTKTVRPPLSVSGWIKSVKLREAGLTEADKSRLALDHIIPISLGGAPADPDNLQLQPWDDAKRKDAVEACLARAVCAGAIALDEARRRIWEDWREAGKACE